MHPSTLRNTDPVSIPSPLRHPAVKTSSEFDVDPEDLGLLQKLTGINDVNELEEHISNVQKTANQGRLNNYPCIGMFTFTKFNIKLSPTYAHALSLGKTRKDAIFLDVGCCVGNALRKVVADGWPAENTIGVDLYKEFWEVGHELFRSTPDSFPASFIGGDLFDDVILTPLKANDPQNLDLQSVKLHDLKSLTPLQYRVSAIYACNFFHLFNAEKQFELAKRLASLLLPSSGSVIFGSHGVFPSQRLSVQPGGPSFHTAESFADMWKQVFDPDTVEISWKIKSRPQRKFSALGRWDIIWWSVVYV
ncbi:hypothetical protein GYMLUDRAFT_153601 [Collybiopsis luxurians FD-317 M1]|nr:hypothetical protein GYMLUDRAFT_153601 [Collybiopsis luxurians FD-317 M1]